MPLDNVAVTILFADMILDISGTILLWYILFKIPYSEGRVS